MIPKEELPTCPVETTLSLLNNKWKVLIIRELLSGTKRFGEIKEGLTNVSQKVLTQNLRSMENDGIIARKVFAEVPPRVEYSITELGDTLKPIIKSMEEWGLVYQELKADSSSNLE
ncbi:winged helix-turn-helix transcriptional regulator [Alkalihalobacillus sp. 1P02AB]|uniref:winged helix-turn-helix transcriptional regulator n=1 Tax=Alkalihalobacillus sp. 1P02AB TaxID=3132260 RepID=UPI0039A5953A